MDSVELKKAGFGLGLGALLFFIIVKTFDRKKDLPQPEITEMNINTAITAYQDALDNNEDLATLNQLNDELAKQFGLRVGLRADGKYTITNLSGTQIKVV